MDKFESWNCKAASSKSGVRKLYNKLRLKIATATVATPVVADATSRVCEVPNGDGAVGSLRFKRGNGMFKHQRVIPKISANIPQALTTEGMTLVNLPRKYNTMKETLAQPTQPMNGSPLAGPTLRSSLSSLSTSISLTSTTEPPSIHIDSDDEYQFNTSSKPLVDEIFEELKKAAYDETKTKLHAVLQNFDIILSEYNSECAKKAVAEQGQNLKPCYQVVGNHLTEFRFPKGVPALKSCKSCDSLESTAYTQFVSDCMKSKYKSYDNIAPLPEKVYSNIVDPTNSKNHNLQRSKNHSQSSLELLTICSTINDIPALWRCSSLNDLLSLTLEKSSHSLRNCIHSPPRKRKGIKKEFELTRLSNEKTITGLSAGSTSNQLMDPKCNSASEIPNQSSYCDIAAAVKTTSTRDIKPVTHTIRRELSDKLIEKCLEKGYKILRTVKAMQTSSPASRLSQMKSLENTSPGISTAKVCPLKEPRSQLLHYANDIKLSGSSSESCKNLPITDETSVKQPKLLVNVVHIKPTKISATTAENINNSNVWKTANSDCTSRVEKLRSKFESVCGSGSHENKHMALRKSACMATKSANIEAIRCIQTQVEIYPTYRKEITIRLL